MRRKGLSKAKRLRLTLASSLFIVLTIPLVVFTLLNSESFDPSSNASESIPQNCSFEFIYVNPNTIQAGSTLQLRVMGQVFDEEEQIQSINIVAQDSTKIFSKEYNDVPVTSVVETFTYTSEKKADTQTILGSLVSNKGSYPCSLYDARANIITTQQANLAPSFTTNPNTQSVPSNNIKVDEPYKYDLSAEDRDGDRIEYSYSFTPGADWLNMSVVANGTAGDLKLSFSGTPRIPESYLANVFAHDGYTNHLVSQSWVISVEQKENDIPQVIVVEPISGTRITQGQVLRISWSATDLNQIVQYKLYYAENPGNASSWIPINENVAYNVGTYLFDTSAVNPGTYRVIVQAVDNQTPAAVGSGISEAFGVNEKPIVIEPTEPTNPDPSNPVDPSNPDEPDDGVQLQDPQIINLSPEPDSEVTNNRRTISATLIASKEADVNIDSIKLTLDGKDVSDKVEISEISSYEVTVIYKPTEDLNDGEHKVELIFNDTADKEADRTWTFEVNSETSDDVYIIFGMEIPKRTVWIIGAGILIILLALLIPWLLYLAWRNSDDDEYDLYTTSVTPTSGYAPYTPPGNTTVKSYTDPNLGKTTSSSTSTTSTNGVKTPTLHTQPTSTTSTSTSEINKKAVVTGAATGAATGATIASNNKSSSSETKDYRYPAVGNNSSATQPVSNGSSAIAYPPKASANVAKPAQPAISSQNDIIQLAQQLKPQQLTTQPAPTPKPVNQPVAPVQRATNPTSSQSSPTPASGMPAGVPNSNSQTQRVTSSSSTPSTTQSTMPKVTPSQPLPTAQKLSPRSINPSVPTTSATTPSQQTNDVDLQGKPTQPTVSPTKPPSQTQQTSPIQQGAPSQPTPQQAAPQQAAPQQAAPQQAEPQQAATQASQEQQPSKAPPKN